MAAIREVSRNADGTFEMVFGYYNLNYVEDKDAEVDFNLVMTGQGVDCVMNGLYAVGGKQLVDHHTIADHAQPHCGSHEFYHGILGGQSRGVFNGKIFVRKDAQKTDAKQTNRALLLSEDAQVNANPQLEIFADDVRCTHGATVGQLDDEAMFYLQARGIPPAEARDILLYNKNRVFAFVLALGEVDDLKYATAAGAINFGFPVIADTVIPEILPTGVTTYEHVVSVPFNEIDGADDLERAADHILLLREAEKGLEEPAAID